MKSTRIIREISKKEFREIIRKYKHKIIIREHAVDHLLQAQRGVATTETLINTILRKEPVLVGIQRNGRIATFFREKEGHQKIILEERQSHLEIITFINVNDICKIGVEDEEITTGKEG